MPETITRFLRRGGIFYLTLALATLILLAWMGAASLRTLPSRRAAVLIQRPKRPDPPTAQELAVTLTRLGLDANSLAAAGLSGPQVTSLIGRVSDALQSSIQTLRDADDDWGARRAEVDRLERLVRAGINTEQNVPALTQARADLAASTSSRQSALDAVLTQALQGLSSGPTTTLQTLHANAAGWDLPTPYLAASHPEPDWVLLRDAIANDRVSSQLGVQPNPIEHQYLLEAQADPAVSAASANLATNLPDVANAWNAAVFH